MTKSRILAAHVLFAAGMLAAGCGGSSTTPANTAPSEKQKQKELMKPGPGAGGPSKK